MALFDASQGSPELGGLSLLKIMLFIHVLSILKEDILVCQPIHISTEHAPSILPPSILNFIAEAVGAVGAA
jgi:hypothetical protein